MPSEVDICNNALSRLGANSITSLTQDSVNARACNLIYVQTRDAELRARAWSFAITRASLAASATAPLFGRRNAYPLPSDFLRLVYPDQPYDYFMLGSYRDWEIEGRQILTADLTPLYIRYVAQITDVNQWDTLFRDAMSAKLAVNLCEKLTQSNSKKQAALMDYKDTISEARKQNAFAKPSSVPQEDSYISLRY